MKSTKVLIYPRFPGALNAIGLVLLLMGASVVGHYERQSETLSPVGLVLVVVGGLILSARSDLRIDPTLRLVTHRQGLLIPRVTAQQSFDEFTNAAVYPLGEKLITTGL